MPLFYHKYVNYVLAHSVNYVITLYSLPLPLHRILPPSQPLQKDNNPSPRTIPCFAPHSCHMNALLVLHPCLVSH